MKKLALALAAALPLTLLTPAASAQAASCVVAKYTNTSEDYARITNVSGGCTVVKVQHQYSMASASKDYWTSWVKGKNSATTPKQPQLVKAQFNWQ